MKANKKIPYRPRKAQDILNKWRLNQNLYLHYNSLQDKKQLEDQSMKDLIPVKFNEEVVITTKMLADVYETEEIRIQQNFNSNQEKFK